MPSAANEDGKFIYAVAFTSMFILASSIHLIKDINSSYMLITTALLFAITYYQSVTTNPGHPSKLNRRKSLEDLINHVDGPDETLIDVCHLCGAHKPPRCHHCRKTDMCVLRMDHYCVWIANTVGHRNQAHFNRMLVYGTLACILAFVFNLSVALDFAFSLMDPTDEVRSISTTKV
jgi:DHHC palmitoyltransferase